jgi:hypothetical protein
LSLNIYYDGGEVDNFETRLAAVSAIITPSDKLKMKLIGNTFSTNESETFDIQGQYFINQLDKDFSSETYGDSILNIGVGTFLDHARNYLTANVYSLAFKGTYTEDKQVFKWGIKYKQEYIEDKIREWKMVDSAGFSIPYHPGKVLLSETRVAESDLFSERYTGFMQNIYSFDIGESTFDFTFGLRGHYWTFNDRFFFSPRASIAYQPNWARTVIFHLASGYYYQPPFFKEIRDKEGNINHDIKAQKSIHHVFSSDFYFSAWDRPFKWSTEVYYKQLDDLIPYKVDNVRVDYSAENMAKGYATGIDMKVNGEFVEGVESWMSLSLMKTEADIDGDYYYDQDGNLVRPGYYRRPTDQLVSFSMFFQDYFPNNPTYKVNLNLVYGSRVPFSSPFTDRYDNGVQVELPAYKRVDIGLSKVIINNKDKASGVFGKFKNIWLSAEVFNLFGIRNSVSYMWIKTLSNQAGVPKEFVVPNHLTSRRYNIKLTANF